METRSKARKRTFEEISPPIISAKRERPEHQSKKKSELKAQSSKINPKEQQKLFEACFDGNVKLVRSLLKTKQVDVDASYDAKEHGKVGGWSFWSGYTCLIFAAATGYQAVVQMLIDDFKANVEAQDGLGCTALHWAAANNHVDIVRLLIENYDAEINSKDQQGKTPLMMTAEFGHSGIVECLIQHGANVNERDICGRSALSLAKGRDTKEVLKVNGATK